jgi:glycosyltransferase involved in cell wall biosynthesis
MEPLISVIIPCYNGSIFIEETLNSILGQSEKRIEVIVIDDGSTDDSATLIKSYSDNRLHYYFQTNQGVSAARNSGFSKAKGLYVIFFDADDLMTKNFLADRLNYLENNTSLDFISGVVQRFNERGNVKGYFRGVGNKAAEEILLYHGEVDTCPSNYFFRKEFLKKNIILFNTKLSSTADRFFLLECANCGQSEFVNELGVLKYRVTPYSMSGKLTSNLTIDNEVYYRELSNSDLIPEKIRNKAVFLGSFILFASYWKVGMKLRAFKFAMICLVMNPIAFIKRSVTKNFKGD